MKSSSVVWGGTPSTCTVRPLSVKSKAIPALFSLRLRRRDGLVQIPDDVVEVFDPHREAHQVLRYAGFQLLLVAQLLVRGGGGMDDQALGIAQVRQVREQLRPSRSACGRRPMPPLMPKVTMEPCPCGRYFCDSA